MRSSRFDRERVYGDRGAENDGGEHGTHAPILI
jgi:hypothetical protein